MRIKLPLFLGVCIFIFIVSAGGTLADIIIMENGRTIEGTIISKDRDSIKIKTDSGITMTIQKDTIARIVTRKSLLKTYTKKLKKLSADDVDGHYALAEWCKKNGLKDKYREELEKVLKLDPSLTRVKEELDRLKGKSGLENEEEKQASGDKKITAKKKPPIVKKKKPKKPSNRKKKKDDDFQGSRKKPAGAKAALKKVLDFLAKNQTKRGNWGKEDMIGTSPTVMVSYAALALMASGSTMSSGPYKDNVKKAVDWTVKNICTAPTAKGPWKPKPNWKYAIGGLLLCEAYAENKDPAIAKKIREVVVFLEKNQEATGGYGHFHPGPCESGYTELTAVSVWAVATLGMAKQLGIEMDETKYTKARDYLVKCSRGGPMRYSHCNGANPCPGRTGGGMLGLAMCGMKPKNKHMKKMASYMQKAMKRMEYGHALPAIHFVAGAAGSIQFSEKLWDLYVVHNFPKLIAAQKPDGSFNSIPNPTESRDVANEQADPSLFVTCMYALCLALDEGGLKFMSGIHAKKTFKQEVEEE